MTNREGIIRWTDQVVVVRAPSLQWERVYGEYWQDALFALAPALDGGFVLVGGNYSHGGQNSFRLWVLKTDSRGRTVWEKYLADPEGRHGTGTAIVPAPGGGHVIAGFRRTTLFETSEDGGTLVGTGGPWLYENLNPFDMTSGYFAVTKTGPDGAVEWNTLLGLSHHQACTTWVAPTPDGGAYAAGTLAADICLLRLDATGSPVWTNSWGMDRRAEWG